MLYFVARLFNTWQVTIMFVTLDKIAQTDLKYQDIMLLENYASFQNRYCSVLGSDIFFIVSQKLLLVLIETVVQSVWLG